MANLEQVERLRQGIGGWNQWREGNGAIWIDLSEVDLREASLSGANLFKADLREANLRGADLHGANLHGADLRGADLRGTDLRGTDLTEVLLDRTTLVKIDLRQTKGLATLHHQGPSDIELFTVHLPQDGSALQFLRGVGVPEEWIDDYRVRMMQPIQYYSCFISYSSQDELLAGRLHADLQAQGVRCWFAPEDMKTGDRIRQRIDEAIHVHEKLLLLLSEHSLASTWVEQEVEAAFEKEQRQQREVLFPIRLDDTVMRTVQSWAATLRRIRHIGDFTRWTDPQAYQVAFKRLLADLKRTDRQ